jgi:hypothetical protein
MKKLFYVLVLVFSLTGVSNAQSLVDNSGVGRIREKLVQYVEEKLSLSKDETTRFEPVYINYLHDLRSTNQQYKGDKLVLQDKVVELRLRYRDQFKPIIGEKRSNDVFVHEREFVKQAREEMQTRLQGRH